MKARFRSRRTACGLGLIAMATVLAMGDGSVGEESRPQPAAAMMFMNPDGTNLRQFFAIEGRMCGSPSWSPDGSQIAYDTWNAGESFEESEIVVIDVQTKEEQRIGRGAMPNWSPDGSQIVCHTYDTPARDIVVMDVNGEGREPIMDHWGSPCWSPVGNRIVAAHSRGGLAVFDLVTGKEWIVAPSHRAFQGLDVSPDGRQVVFGDISGGVVLATLNDDATRATTKQILNVGESYHAAWSPSSQQVVFAWRPDRSVDVQLYFYDVEKGGEARLLPGQDPRRNNEEIDWSPDGKTLVFVSRD